MALKVFSILLVAWILLLVYGNPEVGIRGSTILVLTFIGAAVWAITDRLERIRRQLQDSRFDPKEENRKELLESIGFFVSILGLLIMGTFAQGFVRCIGSGEDLSVGCIWQGTMSQVADDLD